MIKPTVVTQKMSRSGYLLRTAEFRRHRRAMLRPDSPAAQALRMEILRSVDRLGTAKISEISRAWAVTHDHIGLQVRRLVEDGLLEFFDHHIPGALSFRLTDAGRRAVETADWEEAVRMTGTGSDV